MIIDLDKERKAFESTRKDKLKNVKSEIDHDRGRIYVANTVWDQDEASDLDEQWWAWQQRAKIAQAEINDLKQQIAELHASRESLLEYKNNIESV